MVAKVRSGKSIRGVLNYNENKVRSGKATCIAAVGFGCEAGELSFTEKLNRFTELTSRNHIAKTNAIHISLNFDPSEKLSEATLQQIAERYLQKIGFNDQPYLVYEHLDAHHQHIHIATTNIREDGSRIAIHNIGKNESSAARKEIEKEFGLIEAESKEQIAYNLLKPVDLAQALYGKVETKAAISGIVRSVVSHYKFTSLAELNAALHQFNVTAHRGEPGTRMYESGGLVYQLLDEKGERVGNPIKASSIYEKPTLKNIENKFKGNEQKRKNYRARVIRTIDLVLKSCGDREGFIGKLKEEGIHVLFRENKEHFIYGVTYVDNLTSCIFNGSDLGKGYSAKAIMERLTDSTSPASRFNGQFVSHIIQGTDFTVGFNQVMAGWLKAGLMVRAFKSEDGTTRYALGHYSSEPANFIPADNTLSSYFRANGLYLLQSERINELVKQTRLSFRQHLPTTDTSSVNELSNIMIKDLAEIIRGIMDYTYTDYYVPPELLREAKRRRRKRRR